jgi:hypothetical protein
MALTLDQKTALKAAIVADEVLNALPNNSDTAITIAQAFNLPASPDWWVWRTAVTRKEILQNGFNWTRLDNLSVGKARIWQDIFVDGELNPSKANVRTGIEAVWVGTQADLDQRAAVYIHCKKLASRVQKLFSTGTGSNGDPATMDVNIDEAFEVSGNDVETARQLP